MGQRLGGKLECSECHTTYLRMPEKIIEDSPVFCVTCGNYIGRWHEIQDSIIAQGGLSGVFDLHDGHIIRR